MNKFNRTEHAQKNIAAGILNKALSILMPFAMRTVMIRCLGMEYLGLDNLFSSILQVLNLSELGLSSAIVYCMYKPVAEGDTAKVNSIYAFYRKAYHIIGCVVLVAGLAVLPFLDFLISGSAPAGLNIRIVYVAYVLNSSLSFLLFAYKNVLLNVNQRLDVSYNILSISRMIMYACQIIALVAVGNYYVYIIFLPLCTVINNLITSFWVDRMFPEYRPEGKIDADVLKDIKHQVSGLCVSKICLMSRNASDSMVVSAFLGLTMTAIYNNYYYIMNAVVAIMIIFSGSMLPGVGNSMAVESVEKNYRDFKKFNFLFVWISGIAVACLLCLYQRFMYIWVGADSMLPMSSVILFCVYFFAQMIGNVRAVYADAAGLWWQNRKRSIMEAVANIILNIVLGKIFGVNGIIGATVLTIIVINFGFSSMILFKYYFININIHEFFKDTIYYSFATLLSCVVSYFVTSRIPVYGIPGLLLAGIICLALTAGLLLVFYRRLSVFNVALEWLQTSSKKILKKRR